MESTEDQKNIDRNKAMEQWLCIDCGLRPASIEALQGDASMRRYFRVHTAPRSLIAMDAPPPQENCRPFVAIAKTLRDLGLNSPEILAEDVDQGFLLLTDFGDQTYLKTLNAQNADQLYGQALDALAVLQTCREVPERTIPPFTREFMLQEWAWHKEWFLGKLLGLQLGSQEKEIDQCVALIVEMAVNQPQVFMHRDYHSANLMVLSESGVKGVGILDFQDAFIGPVTYDLASLLRDCYIDWPAEQVENWVQQYRQKLEKMGVLQSMAPQEFMRWFDWMSLQRHLKALFTFARKHVRDQQSQYLKHVPRTLGYLIQVSQRYPELTVLHEYLRMTVQPAFENMICVQ